MAGGLAKNADPSVKVTRRIKSRRIPLPNAVADPSGQLTVAEIDTNALLSADHASDNIDIEPYDLVLVPPFRPGVCDR